MRRNNYKIYALLILFGLGLSLCPQPTKAAGATLYLSPSSGTKAIGATFTVGVKVNSGGEVINAAEGSISYDTNLLDVVSVSKGGSIFPFWTAEPGASGGIIRFGGGLPPPAYNGSAGHIIGITFKGKRAGEARVSFTSGAVLANDGKGTNIIAGMGSASFTIGAAQIKPSKPKEPTKPKVPDYNKPVITSATHPDQDLWYKETEAQFKWELKESITGVSIAFDQESFTDPGSASDGLFGEKIYTVDKDGHWYLHLKLKDASRWGTIAHYQVNIDTAPPLAFEVAVSEVEIGEWPELSFKTTDELSGLAKYLVYFDRLDGPGRELSPDQESHKVSGLKAGKHTAIIKAIDKAGNEQIATVEFFISAIAAPTIDSYSKELKSSDNFYAKGGATPNGLVVIYIEQGGRLVATSSSAVDAGGKWLYIHDDKLDNGRYSFWAEARNDKGICSEPSEKYTFLVSPPVFTMIGSFVVNYFTVLVSLLFLIVLIVLIIFWFILFIRKKLKKETKEIAEILRRNSIEMKKAIDSVFAKLSANKVGQTKAKEDLKNKVDGNEKKTLKEIQDVEKILK